MEESRKANNNRTVQQRQMKLENRVTYTECRIDIYQKLFGHSKERAVWHGQRSTEKLTTTDRKRK